MRIMPRATYSLRRSAFTQHHHISDLLTSVTVADGPALSLSTTTTEGPAPSSSTPLYCTIILYYRIYIRRSHMTLARARVHSEFSPGNALRHRDIPKRYILTFLKRDGHVRTYVHTYIRTYAPTENRSKPRANALGNYT